MKYNYNDLENIKLSINVGLNKEENLNKTERYGLLKNLKVCKAKINELSEYLLDNVEGFDEFQNKRFKLFVDNGAKTQQLNNGSIVISDTSEIDEEKLEKELNELREEYSDVLKEQEEIIKENENIKNEREVDVEWFKIKFEDISEEASKNILNENTLNFIE